MFIVPWWQVIRGNVLLVVCVLTTVSIITTERNYPVPEASSPLGLHELSINTQPPRMGNRHGFKLMVWVRFTSDPILHLRWRTGQHEWTDQEMTAYKKETTVRILPERCLRTACQHSYLLKEGTREGTACCTCPWANWEVPWELHDSAMKHKSLARLRGCQLLCICLQNKRVYHQVLSRIQQSSMVLF